MSTVKKSPMEAVIVNSIIYSKPSYCRISVDLGDAPVNTNSTSKTNMTNGDCPNNMNCLSETNCCMSMDSTEASINFIAADCLAAIAATSSLTIGEDAKLYKMCTTLNGSINHQISDLCDILAVAEIINNNASGEHDDDSFIEFANRDADQADSDDNDEDEEVDDDDEEDEADFIDDEDDSNNEDEDDYDVVDFSYDCPIEPAPQLCCDQKKKVRFNTKPTVHIMRTWNYAYRAARIGEWEMCARDRERFNNRIQRTAFTLNPILEREHRQSIYDKRFANLFNNDDDSQTEVFDEKIASQEASIDTKSKKPHQKKKRKKRYCKMGNKHYF